MTSRCTWIALLTLLGGVLTLVTRPSGAEPPRYRPASIRLAQEPTPAPADPKPAASDIKPPQTKIPPEWFLPQLPKFDANSPAADVKPPTTKIPPDWFLPELPAGGANAPALDIKPPMTKIPPDWFTPAPSQPAEVVTPVFGANCDWKPWYYCWYACHDCKPGPCAPHPGYPICCDYYCGKPRPCLPSPCYPTCPGCFCRKPPVCKFPGNPCPPCK